MLRCAQLVVLGLWPVLVALSVWGAGWLRTAAQVFFVVSFVGHFAVFLLFRRSLQRDGHPTSYHLLRTMGYGTLHAWPTHRSLTRPSPAGRDPSRDSSAP